MPFIGSRVHSETLTQCERAILILIAEGYKNNEIADELTISEKIVKETQVNLRKKLNAPSISSLINHALKKGLISVCEVLESRFSKREPEKMVDNYELGKI
jgi:DNA-binding NarL/FixJ family response regulator